jgi:hypothetical protein
MLHGFDRWIEIASLNRFCEKFQPRWRPRSLLTPSWAQFGWVVAAAVRAELGTPRQRRPLDDAVVDPVPGMPLAGDGAILPPRLPAVTVGGSVLPVEQGRVETAPPTDPGHIPAE